MCLFQELNQLINQPINQGNGVTSSLRDLLNTIFLKSQISNLNMKHETRNAKHETRNAEHGTLNTEHETLNTEHGTRNTEHGTRNTEPITPLCIYNQCSCKNAKIISYICTYLIYKLLLSLQA